jgi:hypothetical protein
MRRRKNVVYAPEFERELMYSVFPKPAKIKSFTRNQFKDIPHESINTNDDHDFSFVFRGEFEKCGREIKGDIINHFEKKQRKRKRLQDKYTRYYWDEYGINWGKDWG